MLLLNILAFVVVLALLVLGGYAVFILHRRKKYAHIPGPPIKSFFKGHADEFEKNIEKGGRPTDHLFLEWHKMYGKVICTWFYHQPMLSVCDPEIIKDVLITRNYPKSGFIYKPAAYVYGQRCIGRGLFTEMDSEKWKGDRKVMNPAFHRKSLKDMMSSFNASADLLIEKLLKVADGKKEVPMANEFAKFAIDVICKVGFGMDVDVVNDTTNKFPDSVTTLMRGLEMSDLYPYAWMNPLSWSEISRIKSAIRFVRETGRKVIEFRQLATNHGEQVPNDILQHILALPAGSQDMEDLLDHFVTFFLAGHETTAGKMSFCVLELADHPEAEERLVEEVFQVLGDRTYVEFDDLAKMHHLGNALKETLRLYPTVTGTVRTLSQKEPLGGLDIPPDTAVMLSSYVMGRFPEYWANADDFNPTRFENAEEKARSHFTTFPFSLGPRNCIGMHFAQIEAKVLLARFLQTFKFRLAPGQTKKISEAGSLRPQDGVMCFLEKRK